MQRTVTRTHLHQVPHGADQAFWLAQPIQARIDALEELRHHHGQEQRNVDIRLQRVCRVTELKRG